MGTFSIWHWLIVLAVVAILFGGGGRIARVMGDVGKGLKAFRRNLDEADKDPAPAPTATATTGTSGRALPE